ncbi:hypothetical protein C8J56DRAFT_797697, partial [Mycena floridula]
VNQWYSANQDVISAAAASIASVNIDVKAIEGAISTFQETSKVIMNGLDALGQVHPFISVAVVAFKLVVTLDLTRRENNRKVLALKVQMQDTMIVLFQLRHMRDPEEVGPDGTTIKDRMQALIETIANDIKETGSACDHYLKKGFLAKTVKSKIYEQRLAGYGNLFIKHRENLDFALSIHTALGVDNANVKLDSQRNKLETIDEKLDMLLLFRKLDTPREREVYKFIEEKGGAKNCIDNNELLKELIEISGEGIAGVTGSENTKGVNGLAAARRTLTKEMTENVDEAFRKNLDLFGKKLEMQNRQLQQKLQDSIQEQGQHIISAIFSGAHDRIIDQDLRAIWKDMGWKGSVKARHFVLALHDYFTEKFEQPNIQQSSVDSKGRNWNLVAKKPKDDRWTLAYINVSHVQPILEAFDDDGTGFISVKEVNDFVLSKPHGWTLLNWIAYWSQGWHGSIDWYKNKIYMLLQRMFDHLHDVLPMNRKAADEYFYHFVYFHIDLLLRSTQPLLVDMWQDRDLKNLTEAFMALEEEKMIRNLEGVGFEIDDESTVALITGPGRVERYIYPLLYLLLKRHLSVVILASEHVLDPAEFSTLNLTLSAVFNAFSTRIESLESIFKQTNIDVKERLSNFAFGLLSYGDPEFEISENMISLWTCDYGQMSEEVEVAVAEAQKTAELKILKFPVQDTFQSTIYDFDKDIKWGMPEVPAHPASGAWSGHFYVSDERSETLTSKQGLVQLWIENVLEDGTVSGKAETHSGEMVLSGTINADNEVKLTLIYEDGYTTVVTGIFDLDTQSLTGSYTSAKSEDEEDTTIIRTFSFHRTPVELNRFRYTPSQFEANPAQARWSFASKAVLHQVRKVLWSHSFFRATLNERKRLFGFLARLEETKRNLSPHRPLTNEEKVELRGLRSTISPTDVRFFASLAPCEILVQTNFPTFICKGCERVIYKSRLICVTCISETLASGVNLCLNCIDISTETEDFTHEASHSLVKADHFLHDGDLAWALPEALVVVERVKTTFREMGSLLNRLSDPSAEDVNAEDGHKTKGEKVDEPTCCCCGSCIELPCWACLSCSPDTYICLDCDSNKVKALENGPTPWHLLRHPLVLIRDSEEDVEPPDTDTRIEGLEKALGEVDTKIGDLDTGVHNRLQVLQTRFESLEAKIQGLEDKVDSKFAKLESLLQNIVDVLPGRKKK